MTILHVGHSWGGGLQKWIDDFMGADLEESYYLTFRGDSKSYGIHHEIYNNKKELVATAKLLEPIERVANESTELFSWVKSKIYELKIDSVMFSSPFGFSTDLLKLPVKKIVIFHDFSYVCAGTFGYFNQPCESCENERLKDCISNNPATALFKGVSYDSFLNIRKSFEGNASNLILVAPTKTTSDRVQKIAAGLINQPIHIIGHGSDIEFEDCFGGASDNRKLRLIHLGVFQWFKGWAIIESVLSEFRDEIDYYFLGCREQGAKLVSNWSKQVVEEYQHGDLPSLFKAIQPDLGLLISIVPETFSYTLSELMYANIPVVASNMGAFAERIMPGCGFLIDVNAKALRQQLVTLINDRQKIRAAHERLQTLPKKGINNMVLEYKSLLAKI